MGQSPSSETYNTDRNGLPFYQGNVDFGEKYPSARIWCDKPTKIAEPGDILISVRAPIGALNYAKEECCIGRGLAAITPDANNTSPEFIYWLLRANHANLNRMGTGSTFKAINRKTLEDITLPDYKKDEQYNIAKILSKIDDAIRSKKSQIKQLDELVKARFVEMFGPDMDTIALREICKTVSGGTPSTKHPDYYKGNIPWISTTALGPNHIDEKSAKAFITQEAIDNSATKLIPKGNLLFGIRVGVGKTSINDVDICTNQDIVAIMDVDESKFSKLFIKHVLDTNRARYDSMKKGATILGITSDDLKNTPIPLASFSDQKSFESFVDHVDKSKFALSDELTVCDFYVCLIYDRVMHGRIDLRVS